MLVHVYIIYILHQYVSQNYPLERAVDKIAIKGKKYYLAINDKM